MMSSAVRTRLNIYRLVMNSLAGIDIETPDMTENVCMGIFMTSRYTYASILQVKQGVK